MNKTNKLSKEDRSQICKEVFFFMRSLERLQEMPLVCRMLYYKLAYKVYGILRKRKLLGRRVGGFDPLTYQKIVDMLLKFEEDGTTED
jgi:hypothetical protein